MKNTTYIFAFLLLSICSCNPSDTKPEAENINSSLSFKMDYANWKLDDNKSFSDFEQLFEQTNAIRLANIDVMNGTDKVYDFNQGYGDVLISKENDNQYAILEHYIVPIGSVYGKVALLRYVVDAKAGTVTRDKNFVPQLFVYKYWYNHIVKEYDGYLNDSSYTSKDWNAVPHAAFDVMRFLMFNLTLAGIQGCTDCKKRMERITEDFSFVQSAEYGQNLLVCKAILRKFEE